ncbi:MAG: 23S rRNA (uracil(1939)-C(5))-methyltransferase RlmD [Oscillospiraceae bacterium]|nr:23S rRNA (uracil(1939)-C(5))-methyltransferase RlmD [Oscillospiraceae bacterium]
MAELRKNGLVKLKIENWSGDGSGVARLDGLVVFVKGALVGETCMVRLETVHKNAAWGHMEKLLEPSPARVEPDCPYYPRCGGCQLRHMTYAEELQMKRQKVQDALTRIGGQTVTVETIHGAQEPERYRNKAQFPVEPGENGGKVGFFRAGSHQVIPVEHCLLQKPEADAAANAVRQWMRTCQIPAYEERAHRGLIRHVYVRTNRAGESLICLVVNGERVPSEKSLISRLRAACPKAVGILLNVNTKKTNVILGERYRLLWGQDFLMDELCGLTFRLSVPSFYQVNREQAEVLYGRALAFAELTGKETVVDLYCGVGTISLVMAKRAGKVIGAEIVPEAVADAGENARRNGLTNAEFICADAGQAVAELARRGLRPDVVSVDPPRKGLSQAVIDAIGQMEPSKVVYVSCDPATLARDVKLLGEKGYRLTQTEAVDLFPRTGHVETVVQLSKGEINSKKVRVEFPLEDMDMSGFQKGTT